MGYRQSNAAVAYDMQPAAVPAGYGQRSPRVDTRPELHVVSGEGRQADQGASPAFVVVMKAFCVLIALFCAVGFVRIAINGATAQSMNASAELTETLDEGRDTSSSLEVMHSVYSSPSRVRDLATSSLGLVDAEDTVTIDLSDQGAAATSDAADAPAQTE